MSEIEDKEWTENFLKVKDPIMSFNMLKDRTLIKRPQDELAYCIKRKMGYPIKKLTGEECTVCNYYVLKNGICDPL